jgi:hypothetical protein
MFDLQLWDWVRWTLVASGAYNVDPQDMRLRLVIVGMSGMSGMSDEAQLCQ